MKRLPHIAILLVAVALVAADNGEKKKGDAEKIQGKWEIAEHYKKGKKTDGVIGDVFTFSGKKLLMTQKIGNKNWDTTFEIRADKKPKEVDVFMKLGEIDVVWRGVYELSGNTLTICLAEPGKGRPKVIGRTADNGRALMILKRVKSVDKK